MAEPATGSETGAPAGLPRGDDSGRPGAKLLIVDDTPANIELLSFMLKSRGYNVRTAENGEAALDACGEEPPDLILLDISMPGMDGYEVCRRLKADAALKDIPVVFLSALNETVDKVRALEAGGVDYISKPFKAEEVEARVRTHLELRRQKLLLQQNYDRLRELEKMRDGLVHMIIHDLRSPLATIISRLDFFKNDAGTALSPAAARDLDETLKTAEVMLRLIGDLLDASKMESGKMKLNLKECDLPWLMDYAVSTMKPLAGPRELSVEPCGPLRATADSELLARVIQNLVANALKFAPRDGGYVRLAARRVKGGVRVTVENNGPDIPARYQPEIFEKFGQVDQEGKRQPYSTGLGLNFCKLAVQAHGGRIGVESSPGKPTIFWFELDG